VIPLITPRLMGPTPTGSMKWIRLQLMHGWNTPKTGMYPKVILAEVLQVWRTGKTCMNTIYAQSQRLRADDETKEEFGDFTLHEYVRRLEDCDGTTQVRLDTKLAERKVLDDKRAIIVAINKKRRVDRVAEIEQAIIESAWYF